MFNPLRNSVVEICDVLWLHCMYYERSNTHVTELDPIAVIEAENSRDEVVTEKSLLSLKNHLREYESYSFWCLCF